MVVWASTDSQYVQNGVTEWIHKWKRNGWKNGKKAQVANKTLWMWLDAEVTRHHRVEFSWVKAHSGILLSEIANQLATRGVQRGTHCPTLAQYDVLPEDSEKEDGPELNRIEPVITQVDEWDDPDHLPTFSIRVDNEDLAAVEEQERRRKVFNRFNSNVLGNSSAEGTDYSDSDIQIADPDNSSTVILGPGMQIEGDQEQNEPDCRAAHWTWGPNRGSATMAEATAETARISALSSSSVG
jgi:hypothetical protein